MFGNTLMAAIFGYNHLFNSAVATLYFEMSVLKHMTGWKPLTVSQEVELHCVVLPCICRQESKVFHFNSRSVLAASSGQRNN